MALLVCLAAVLCAGDDAAGRVSLRVLQPVAEILGWIGGVLLAHREASVAALLFLSGLPLAALILVAAARRDSSLLSCGLVLGAVVSGQFLFIAGHAWPAVGCYGLAALVGLQWFSPPPPPAGQTRFGAADVLALSVVTAAAVFFRFFALNRVHPTFEGELSPYAIGAMSLNGMVLANAGTNGPWAPLGLLYYLPIYLASFLTGPTVLAVRLGSALVGAGTVILTFFLLRRLSGTGGALIGCLLLSLESLQIGWGRTDVHPHASTTWLTVLLCLVIVLFLEKRNVRHLFWLVPLLALTRHQYPSGQTALLIPLFAALLAAVSERRLCPHHRQLLCAFLAGALLWVISGPLVDYAGGRDFSLTAYVDSLGPRVYASSLSDELPMPARLFLTVKSAAAHAADLVLGLYVKAPYLFHQDILIDIPGVPVRTVNWLTISLATFYLIVAGRNLRSPGSLVVVAWLFAAPLPALFSDHAYPKRAATLYPLLCVMAGLGAAHVFSLLRASRLPALRCVFGGALAAAFLGWGCVSAHQWFSGTRIRFGIPAEVELAGIIAAKLTPGTVGIIDVRDHYFEGKLTYLLLEPLRATSPVAWYHYRREQMEWRDVVQRPASVVQYLRKPPYYYTWTDLGERLESILSQTSWSRALFIIEDRPASSEHIAALRRRYPGAKETAFSGHGACRFLLLETALP